VVLAQSEENKEFVDRVYDYFAVGSARSLNSLNIMTREQADDPRVAEIVQGADLIWIGGGSQCSFLEIWRGTKLFKAIEDAAANRVSIGGTSASTAIFGHAAYINLPWDSTNSSFTLHSPTDQRNRVMFQGADRLPFSALSADVNSPLHQFLVDTHFSDGNRMGRLVERQD